MLLRVGPKGGLGTRTDALHVPAAGGSVAFSPGNLSASSSASSTLGSPENEEYILSFETIDKMRRVSSYSALNSLIGEAPGRLTGTWERVIAQRGAGGTGHSIAREAGGTSVTPSQPGAAVSAVALPPGDSPLVLTCLPSPQASPSTASTRRYGACCCTWQPTPTPTCRTWP